MFTDDPLLIDYGTRYIWIILVRATAMYIPMIANSMARESTFIPMVTMLISSIMNIILDPLLLIGAGFQNGHRGCRGGNGSFKDNKRKLHRIYVV